MARLYRPHVPLAVRIQVAERQAKAKPSVRWGFYLTVEWGPQQQARRLAMLLRVLTEQFGCEVTDLRLDHDPPLAARPRHRRGLGPKTYYTPDANDPDHLAYRPHGPQFARSHLVKTNVRGDHGQFPDRVLIKRERRRREKTKRKPSRKIQSRGFQKGPKRAWPKRKFARRKPR